MSSYKSQNDYRSYESESDSDEWLKDAEKNGDEEESSGYEEKKLTLAQACGLNTMNMFGTGPFITIPFVVAAVDPPGPQALIGYAIAAFACMNDSLVWAELGSMWPDSGGSYVYLRELYGRNKLGRLVAFEFVWQIMISGPMECASGFIATAQYLAYITKIYTYEHHSFIAFGMCVATVYALYREIDEVGTITLVLWAITIVCILFAIIAGYSSFKSEYIATPDGAFDDAGKFFVSLGTAARFAVYDFTGYYDVNFVGKEVQNARKNIPIACVTTCCVVAMCFFLVDTAIIGSLEWRPEHDGYVKLVTSGDESANYIMALFCETHVGHHFAIFFTIAVAVTIFGSCFSFMIGLAQIPYTAAKDGYFYEFLAHEHPVHRGLQDYSLLFVGAVSTIFCFCDLGIVIEGMLTMQLLLQFMGQGFGLMWYRYGVAEQEVAPFKCPLFPVPCIIQLIVFGFIFLTTKTYFTHGVPLMELAIGFLILGLIMYMAWARTRSFWPFDDGFDYNAEDELDHVVVYNDDAYESEIKALRKRVAEKEDAIRTLSFKTKDIAGAIEKKDEEIEGSIIQLGEHEYRILSLYKRILDTESQVREKMTFIAEATHENEEVESQNENLQQKIDFIRVNWGNQGPSRVTKKKTKTTKQSLSKTPPEKWSVEEVYYWWRCYAPASAQRHIKIVHMCHLEGHDLLALEQEDLEDYGMNKVLAHTVLKEITKLKKKSPDKTRRKGDPSI